MASIYEKSQRIIAEVIATADEMESPHLPLNPQLPKVQQGQIGDLCLPEDVDWANSCLNDPDASQINWSSWDAFSCALNETLSSETESPAVRTEDDTVGAVIEPSPFSLQMGSAKILGSRAYDDSFITKVADENSDDQLILPDIPLSSLMSGNRAPPASEKLEKFPASATATEEVVDFAGVVMEDSTRDIFKVWDLNLQAVEDELINQLGNGYAQSSLNTAPPWESDDSRVLKGSEDSALDDIISGMSDISLNNSYR